MNFEQFMGSEVDVRLYQPIDGSKLYTGTLTGYEDGRVSILCGKKDRSFEKTQVAQVRLHVTI